MELCSSGHSEVCYECRHCPACEINDRLSEAESEVRSEKERADTAERRADQLQQQVDGL